MIVTPDANAALFEPGPQTHHHRPHRPATPTFGSLLMEDVAERRFPTWAMLDDEAPSLFWSRSEVAAGALEAAGPAELRDAFASLRGLQLD